MAKNGIKTDAFGQGLSPDTFGVKSERTQVRPVQQKPGKSLTRNISITLQEEAIEKLNKLAEEQDISKSKVINRWLMSL
jgi:hypothetical protein